MQDERREVVEQMHIVDGHNHRLARRRGRQRIDDTPDELEVVGAGRRPRREGAQRKSPRPMRSRWPSGLRSRPRRPGRRGRSGSCRRPPPPRMTSPALSASETAASMNRVSSERRSAAMPSPREQPKRASQETRSVTRLAIVDELQRDVEVGLLQQGIARLGGRRASWN